MFRRVRISCVCACTARVSQPPLTKLFPGTPLHFPADATPVPSPKPVTVTSMPNGARVISQDSAGFDGMSSVGAYILAGPAYDPVPCPGVGVMLSLALNHCGNAAASRAELSQLSSRSAVTLSNIQERKHFIGLRLDGPRTSWKEPVATLNGRSVVQSLLFSSLAAPSLPKDDDLQALKQMARYQTQALQATAPAAYAAQQLETVAFYKNCLGAPSFVPLNNLLGIQEKDIELHYNRHVIPSRIVIAGVNVNHNELVAAYENTPEQHTESAEHHKNAIKNMGKVSSLGAEALQYTGGERQDHMEGVTTTAVAVGWLAYGRHQMQLKGFATALVVQSVLELAFRDLTGHGFLGNSAPIAPFYHPYQTAGLLGFTVVSESDVALKLVKDGANTVRAAVSAIPSEQLESAKQSASVKFQRDNLSSPQAYCNFLGTSFAEDPTSEVFCDPSAVPQLIEGVTLQDVKDALHSMLSKKASLYAFGSTLCLPSISQIGL